MGNRYQHFYRPDTFSTAELESRFGITTKPCRFCGNPYGIAEPGGRYISIACPTCGAEGPKVSIVNKDVLAAAYKALNLWNGQQPQQTPEKRID